MLDVDVAIAAALRGSHTPCSRLSALDASGAVVQSWEGRVGARRARLMGGTVTYDHTASIRRRASVTIENRSGALSPLEPGDAFFGGARFRVERGLVLDGFAVYLALFEGHVVGFRAETSGTLTVDGEDPLTLCAQPFGDVVSVAAGTPAADAVVALLGPVLGDTSAWSLDDGGRTCPDRAWTTDDVRLASTWQLMADLGLDLFCDRRGQVVLRPIPDPTTAAPVRAFTREPGTAALLSGSRSGTRLPYNRVVVIAEHEDGTVVRSQADVTDTSSPIHADRIGLRVAPVYRSAQIPDQAAANAVANAMLVEHALYADAYAGDLVPDLTLDEGDVVTFSDQVTGVDAAYRIDQVTHPVVTGSMTLATSKVLSVAA
jgi:hypothetical protein